LTRVSKIKSCASLLQQGGTTEVNKAGADSEKIPQNKDYDSSPIFTQRSDSIPKTPSPFVLDFEKSVLGQGDKWASGSRQRTRQREREGNEQSDSKRPRHDQRRFNSSEQRASRIGVAPTRYHRRCSSLEPTSEFGRRFIWAMSEAVCLISILALSGHRATGRLSTSSSRKRFTCVPFAPRLADR
jgi:hypothetical protein